MAEGSFGNSSGGLHHHLRQMLDFDFYIHHPGPVCFPHLKVSPGRTLEVVEHRVFQL